MYDESGESTEKVDVTCVGRGESDTDCMPEDDLEKQELISEIRRNISKGTTRYS